MRKRIFAFLPTTFLLIAPLAGAEPGIVSESAETIRYREVDGTETLLTKHPRRTIVGNASFADPWFTAGGSAIGVPTVRSQQALPEQARDLPRIGVLRSLNLEKIFAMKPDLVLINANLHAHRAVRHHLIDAGIPNVALDYANFHDYIGILDLFCRLNGGSVETNSTAKRIISQVRKLTEEAARLPSPRFAVLFVASGGFVLESGDLNVPTMAEMLGGTNIARQESGRLKYSFEQLLIDDPDIILINTMGDSKALQKKFTRDLISQPAWQQLKAAKTGRVHFLPPELFLYMAGSRYPEAFLHLAKLLHPEKEFTL
ncbi:ABC transporter substrate-binding protein [uncultured Victivallis sp.]|uniref:ABC transporter substrate-binding protein n=1 Tax=uncultured Victivallis sp. TaxID=354118 RepID=UPI0025EC5BC5|nr:ABC transporter substrate-binding protein [uncultured Victivallis sp.]